MHGFLFLFFLFFCAEISLCFASIFDPLFVMYRYGGHMILLVFPIVLLLSLILDRVTSQGGWWRGLRVMWCISCLDLLTLGPRSKQETKWGGCNYNKVSCWLVTSSEFAVQLAFREWRAVFGHIFPTLAHPMALFHVDNERILINFLEVFWLRGAEWYRWP